MKLIRTLSQVPIHAHAGAVSIGNFDGVHLGHAHLITELRCQAEQAQGPSVVVTFDPHPMTVLRPERRPPRLTGIERRAELLGNLGVDFLVVCPTNKALLQKTATQFFNHVVIETLGAAAVVEGANFCFGRNRQGDIRYLQGLCTAAGIQLTVVDPQDDGSKRISSTRIRHHLSQGEISAANRMLTQPYAVRGQVIKGQQRGAKIGFPTANLGQLQNMPPGPGVYASTVSIAGQRYVAATHIGANPTFGEDQWKLEVHVLDWKGELYGQMLQVDFVARVRDIAQFDSVEALCHQLESDIDLVRHLTQ